MNEKWFSNATSIRNNDFSQNPLKNSLKIENGYVALPYNIKDIWVYLKDTGSHILTLIQNNIEES